MNDTSVEVHDSTVIKCAVTVRGNERVAREQAALNFLHDSIHTPKIVDKTNDPDVSFTLEFIDGENAKQWLVLSDDWQALLLEWSVVKKRLRAYVAAEMDLLSRGALYRDLNLEHLIFQDDTAILIDHESTLINRDGSNSKWQLDDMRGTWETMAPEEFDGRGILTTRTATYRTAVVSHLALTGQLPFERFPHRSDTYKWRRQNPPKVNFQLSKSTRRVFNAALSRKSIHRHKDPVAFFEALQKSIER